MKLKILQHSRLDANSFILAKMLKASKNCNNIVDNPTKIVITEICLRTNGNRGSTGFFTLYVTLALFPRC